MYPGGTEVITEDDYQNGHPDLEAASSGRLGVGRDKMVYMAVKSHPKEEEEEEEDDSDDDDDDDISTSSLMQFSVNFDRLSYCRLAITVCVMIDTALLHNLPHNLENESFPQFFNSTPCF